MKGTKADPPVLSILITVFNQSDVLRWNLDSILTDKTGDYEVVIQDDCSEEPIEELVRSYHDNRIRYYRNPVNYGHDRNIIEGFQNCRSDYVFLLRTSDTILPGKVKTIIDEIAKHPNVVYGRFSCVDESGVIRFRYENYVSDGRRDTIRLNEKLWIHPSGELYNKRYLHERDWKTLKEYLERFFHDRNKFILNEMMRDLLCTRGPFFSSDSIVWVYPRIAKRKDVAQNRSRDGVCIYAPSYMYERFRCEISYMAREVGGRQEKKDAIARKVDLYARMTIWDFRRINKDPDMQRHYGYKEVPFSCLKELKTFRKETFRLAETVPNEYRRLLRAKAAGLSFVNIGLWWAKSLAGDMRAFLCNKDSLFGILRSYIPGYKSGITTEELNGSKDFYIEPSEVEELVYGSKVTHYHCSSIPLGKIRRSKDGRFTSFKETVNYKFLFSNGSDEAYETYQAYANEPGNRRDNPGRSPELYLRLQNEVLSGGYDPKKGIIVLDQYNNVLVGLHRACILLREFGEEYSIPVLKTRVKGSRFLFFRAARYEIGQFFKKNLRR